MSARGATEVFSDEQALALRAERHALDRRRPAGELAAVAGACGVHAQAPRPEVALWARMAGLSQEAVAAALWERRELVMTWAMRGTPHLLPAEQIAAYTAPFRPADPALATALDRLYTGERHWVHDHGFTGDDATAVIDVVCEALDGDPLPSRELTRLVAGRLPKLASVLGQWGSDVFKHVGYAGLICYGPPEGQQRTFVRLDRWLDRPAPELDPETARQELARRYLRTYGPSTRAHFLLWSGLDKGPGQAAWEGLTQLEPVEVGGHRASVLREDLEPLARARANGALRLLPETDVYLAARDRDRLVADGRTDVVYRRGGRTQPAVVLDGRVVGAWSPTRSGTTMGVSVTLVRELDADARDALEREAEGLARFHDARLRLEVGE